MNTKIIVAATALAVVALASVGIAVNAATLGTVPASEIGRAPEVLIPSSTPSDDNGGLRPDGVSDDATPTPSPTGTTEPGDDGLPRHSGEDERPGHDAGDDNPDNSNSGSGSSGSDDDSSGHGGHGSDD